jgi:hypothetical protein
VRYSACEERFSTSPPTPDDVLPNGGNTSRLRSSPSSSRASSISMITANYYHVCRINALRIHLLLPYGRPPDSRVSKWTHRINCHCPIPTPSASPMQSKWRIHWRIQWRIIGPIPTPLYEVLGGEHREKSDKVSTDASQLRSFHPNDIAATLLLYIYSLVR